MATQASANAISVIVDLPRNGPFKDWKKFKDVARTALNINGHQPGWTEMETRVDGSAVGFTICKNNEDARLIYDHLIALTYRECCANVHWYDTSYSRHYPMACNCPTEQHRVNFDYYRHHVQFLAQSPAHYMATASPVPYAQPATVWAVSTVPTVADPAVQALTSNMQGLAMGQNYQYAAIAHAPSPYYPVQAPVPGPYAPATPYSSSYVTNSQGYPVNAANGLVRSEHNVVILKNLDPKITEHELRQIAFEKTISPISLDIKPSSDGKKRTSAIATFRNHKDAKRVAEHFRKRDVHVLHRVIRADIGKDSSPRSAVQPIVVNGSTEEA